MVGNTARWTFRLRTAVSVEFDSVHDALPDSAIRIVPQSDEGLAEGMRAFLRGEVSKSFLDGIAYNRAAVLEFYAVTVARSELEQSGI